MGSKVGHETKFRIWNAISIGLYQCVPCFCILLLTGVEVTRGWDSLNFVRNFLSVPSTVTLT